MNKQEIIEAINSTIMPNGQKGITAEALANILIEMVNASAEGGSGSGALRVWITEAVNAGSLTSEQVAENVATYNAIAGGLLTPVMLCTKGAAAGYETSMCIMSDNVLWQKLEAQSMCAILATVEGTLTGFALGSDGSVTMEAL